MKINFNLHHYIKSGIFTSVLLLSGCGEDKKDNIAPEITIIGDKKVFLTIGDTYQDSGATAIDDMDGEISSSIQAITNVDSSTPGKYSTIYRATDTDGNSATKIREIIVQDFITSPKPRSGLTINEILAVNTYSKVDPKFRQFSDWIELYNNDNSAKDIGGYYLSDDISNSTKWQVPLNTTIKPKSYLLIWADKKDTGLHTNFKLSADGEIVTLFDKSGNIIDSVKFGKQKSDISCSKINDKIYYMKPTPASANDIAHGELWRSKKPNFSLKSGFYDEEQIVELTPKNKGEIYYTTDGSIPTKNSNKYTQPISINKTTVIRARTLESKKFFSSVKNKTYLIDENIKMPVVSIAIDPKYLYDDKIGIYAAGTDKNGNPYIPFSEGGTWGEPNYFRDWMRPASIEYFKDAESKFSENVGLRIYGDGSRQRDQKSMAIFAKDRYGKKSINYKLFPDRNIEKIKSFTLRRSDERTNLRDGLSQTIIKDNMDLDYQAHHSAVIFINGKYWGILNVQEKLNENYLKAHHNVDKDAVNIVGHAGKYKVTSGTSTEYIKLIEYIKENDGSASVDDFYKHISSKIDLKNYLNYIITQNFMNNTDWDVSNVKFWKEQKEDSKWRWMLYDLDSAFWSPKQNPFVHSLGLEKPWSTYFQRSLLNNSKIQNEFISRFTSHLYTTFQPERIKGIIDQLSDPLKPEIKRHFVKWAKDNPSDNPNSNFDSSLNKLYSFANNRQTEMRKHLATQFGVTGNNILTIQTSQNGTIYLDDIKLDSTFNGDYFNSAKVTLKAIPNEGYEFVRWGNGDTNPEIIITLNTDFSIDAEFSAN